MAFFFFALWLGVVGTCVSLPHSVKAAGNPLGEGCEVELLDSDCIACFVTAAANDTIVFTMISWKIISFFSDEGPLRGECIVSRMLWRASLKLPRVSYVIFRTGQQYFL